MRDYYDLLFMNIDDLLNVCMPIGLFILFSYLFKVENWKLFIFLLIFTIIINTIKWESKE